MIKPIQTIYKGYKFRSRLEARWAVFFEACGADWEYEPEGFDLGDEMYYLPDFLLHNVDCRSGSDIYVEVKGQMTEADAEKIRRFADSAPCGIAGTILSNPILVVGKIPNGSDWRQLQDDMLKMNYDTELSSAPFFGYDTLDADAYTACLGAAKQGGVIIVGPDHDQSDVSALGTVNAYAAARQARFEHGERPIGRNSRKESRKYKYYAKERL